MGDFDGARIKPKNKDFDLGTGDFEGARVRKKKSKKPETSLYDDILQFGDNTLNRVKQFGSGALSGITRAGLAEGADQFGAGVMEVAPGVVAPIKTDAAIAGSKAAEKGLEALESMRPDEDDALGNVLYKAGEFGGGVASMPIPGVGAINSVKNVVPTAIKSSVPDNLLKLAAKYTAKGIGKSYNTLKNPIVEGSLIGAGSGALEQGGVNPFAADITSMLIMPTAIRSPRYAYQSIRHPNKTMLYPTARKMFGINKDNFNLRAAEAAERLGIDLNLSELNPSNNIAFTNTITAKHPWTGESVKLHNKNIDDKVKDLIQENLNLVGPQETPETLNRIAKKYKKADKLYPKNPEDRMVMPYESLNSALEIKNNPTGPAKSIRPSSDEKKVISFINKYINRVAPSASIDGVKIPGYKPQIQPIDSAILLSTKKSLNSNNINESIRWNNADPNIRNMLKPLNKSITNDALQLKDRYPEWYTSFKEAEKLYGDVASRKKFEDKLINGGFNYDDFNYQPVMLSRNLNTPKKIKNIKHTYKNKSKEIKEKLDKNLKDLGVVSDAIVKRNRSNPNPSGTAAVAAKIAALGAITSPFLSYINNPNLTKSGIVGIGSGLSYFTAPKFFYNTVVDNKNLIKDTIDNMKNPKPYIPLKNKLINSRINYIYPTINNIKNREN